MSGKSSEIRIWHGRMLLFPVLSGSGRNKHRVFPTDNKAFFAVNGDRMMIGLQNLQIVFRNAAIAQLLTGVFKQF